MSLRKFIPIPTPSDLSTSGLWSHLNRVQNLIKTTIDAVANEIQTVKTALSTGSGLPDIIKPGTFGDGTHVGQFTVNAKGMVTKASNVAITGGGGGGSFDLDDAIKSRCKALTGMQDFSYWSDPFMQRPGQPGSCWADGHGVDQQMNNQFPSVLSVYANSGYGFILLNPSGSYPYTTAVNSPSFWGIVSASQPLYMFVRFRLAPDPGTGGPGGWTGGSNSLIVGCVDTQTLDCAGIGIAATGGAGNFGGVGGDLSSASATVGVDCSVTQDFDWHDAEIFTYGGKWWVSFDNQTPVDVSACINGSMVHATPIIQIMTVVAQQPQIDIDHIAYAAAPILPPLNLTPSHP